MSGYCLTPNEQFFSHIMARTNYIRWDDDARFVLYIQLDQYTLLYLHSARSLKKTASRHVAPRGHIILIPRKIVFALSPQFGKTTNTNVIVICYMKAGGLAP